MEVHLDWNKNNTTLDISGQTDAEKALLTHFQQGHVAILCPGELGYGGLEIFIRDKKEFEYRSEIEDVLGRKRILYRRRSDRKSKARNRK